MKINIYNISDLENDVIINSELKKCSKEYCHENW